MLVLDLIAFIQSQPIAEPKRPGFDFDMGDIELALEKIGASPARSNIYRAIGKMKITKNDRGYYSAPAVAALIGWYMSPNKYSSFGQYVTLAGQSLYDSALNHYTTNEAT